MSCFFSFSRYRFLRVSLCVLGLLVFAHQAAAIGFDAPRLYSTVGEPLLVELPLRSARSKGLVGKRFRVALLGDRDFIRYGAKHEAVLDQLRYQVAYRPDGVPYIRIESDAPVYATLLDIGLRLSWQGGRLLHFSHLDLLTTALSRQEAPRYLLQAALLESPVSRPRSPVQKAPARTTATPVTADSSKATKTTSESAPVKVKHILAQPLLASPPPAQAVAPLPLADEPVADTAPRAEPQPGTDAAPVIPPLAEPEVPSSAPVAPSPVASFLGDDFDELAGLIGIGLVLLVGLVFGVLRWLRRRAQAATAPLADGLYPHTGTGQMEAAPSPVVPDTPPKQSAPVLPKGEDPAPVAAIVSDKSSLFAHQHEPEGGGQAVGMVGLADRLEKIDVLLEKERWKSAERMIQRAMKKHDNDPDLLLRRLELSYHQQDKDAFVAQAETLHHRIGGEQSAIWKHVLTMGRQLCPDAVLFRGDADEQHRELKVDTADRDVLLNVLDDLDDDAPLAVPDVPAATVQKDEDDTLADALAGMQLHKKVKEDPDDAVSKAMALLHAGEHEHDKEADEDMRADLSGIDLALKPKESSSEQGLFSLLDDEDEDMLDLDLSLDLPDSAQKQTPEERMQPDTDELAARLPAAENRQDERAVLASGSDQESDGTAGLSLLDDDDDMFKLDLSLDLPDSDEKEASEENMPPQADELAALDLLDIDEETTMADPLPAAENRQDERAAPASDSIQKDEDTDGLSLLDDDDNLLDFLDDDAGSPVQDPMASRFDLATAYRSTGELDAYQRILEEIVTEGEEADRHRAKQMLQELAG